MSPAMENDQPQSPPPEKRKRAGWVLLASLLINLFLGGLLIGHVYSEEISHFFKHRRGVSYVVQDLSPDSRKIVKTVLDAHSDHMHVLWHQLKDERKKLVQILDAPQVDEAAAQAGFAEMRRIDGAIQAEFHEATLEIVKQLSVEERRKLNLRWKREPRRGRDRGPVRMMSSPRGQHDKGCADSEKAAPPPAGPEAAAPAASPGSGV